MSSIVANFFYIISDLQRVLLSALSYPKWAYEDVRNETIMIDVFAKISKLVPSKYRHKYFQTIMQDTAIQNATFGYYGIIFENGLARLRPNDRYDAIKQIAHSNHFKSKFNEFQQYAMLAGKIKFIPNEAERARACNELIFNSEGFKSLYTMPDSETGNPDERYIPKFDQAHTGDISFWEPSTIFKTTDHAIVAHQMNYIGFVARHLSSSNRMKLYKAYFESDAIPQSITADEQLNLALGCFDSQRNKFINASDCLASLGSREAQSFFLYLTKKFGPNISSDDLYVSFITKTISKLTPSAQLKSLKFLLQNEEFKKRFHKFDKAEFVKGFSGEKRAECLALIAQNTDSDPVSDFQLLEIFRVAVEPNHIDRVLAVQREHDLIIFCPQGAVNPDHSISLRFDKDSRSIQMMGGCQKEWTQKTSNLLSRYRGRENRPDQCTKYAEVFRSIINSTEATYGDFSGLLGAMQELRGGKKISDISKSLVEVNAYALNH